jgi:hypothetical protein
LIMGDFNLCCDLEDRFNARLGTYTGGDDREKCLFGKIIVQEGPSWEWSQHGYTYFRNERMSKIERVYSSLDLGVLTPTSC